MSALLAQRIAFRQLPPLEKSVLLAMANYARDDGTSCRPAQTTLAMWTSRSLVRIKLAVRALKQRGLIAVTRPHAPHRPAEYRLVLRNIEALPSLKREAQQLDLFSPEMIRELSFPQADVTNASGNARFPHSSTGVHRSPAIAKGIAGDPRSVYGSGYRDLLISRARDPKTGTR